MFIKSVKSVKSKKSVKSVKSVKSKKSVKSVKFVERGYCTFCRKQVCVFILLIVYLYESC